MSQMSMLFKTKNTPGVLTSIADVSEIYWSSQPIKTPTCGLAVQSKYDRYKTLRFLAGPFPGFPLPGLSLLLYAQPQRLKKSAGLRNGPPSFRKLFPELAG